VGEEDFNASNKVPPLDALVLSQLLVSELTPYLRDGYKEVGSMAKRHMKQSCKNI